MFLFGEYLAVLNEGLRLSAAIFKYSAPVRTQGKAVTI